jgi:GntR family transcriptional regulator/MocR family aminotransferase
MTTTSNTASAGSRWHRSRDSPDLVAFVGTASKTLAPALRLAWIVPPPYLIDDVENEFLVTGVNPPTLDQIAMASFVEDAALERHLRSMRRRYRIKREVLIQALGQHLPEVRVSGTAAGGASAGVASDGAR